MPKVLGNASQSLQLPKPGSTISIPLISKDGRERFLLDIERGRANSNKWKLQLRYRNVNILVRLDIGGAGHVNPPNAPNPSLSAYANKYIPTPHLQRYIEGFNDGWALPIPSVFTNLKDVGITWQEFLRYCNIEGAPPLQGSF